MFLRRFLNELEDPLKGQGLISVATETVCCRGGNRLDRVAHIEAWLSRKSVIGSSEKACRDSGSAVGIGTVPGTSSGTSHLLTEDECIVAMDSLEGGMGCVLATSTDPEDEADPDLD